MKVIGVHKKRCKFNYNEGTVIKFAIEKFNKKYLNHSNDDNQLNDNNNYYNTLNNFHKNCQYNININNINIINPNLGNNSYNATSENDLDISDLSHKNSIKDSKKNKNFQSNK